MKKIGKLIVVLAVTAQVLAGCGAEKAPAETAGRMPETETAETEMADQTAETETAQTEAAEEDGAAADASAAEESKAAELTPDPTNLSYLEEIQIVDFYGDGAEYPLYAPKGGENTDGFFTFFGHGIVFSAMVYGVGSSEDVQMYLDVLMDSEIASWKGDQDRMDSVAGEICKKGDDRYVILSAKEEDYRGTVYQTRKLSYLSARDGACVSWDMEVSENEQDEETAALVAEVARCYGLDLSELIVDDGTWAKQNAEVEADMQDVYEPEEGEPVLEKVEGYQYLGMVTIALGEEEKVTSPVLAPMGRNTSVKTNKVLATMHGVSVWITGNYNEHPGNYQAEMKKSAENSLDYYNEEEYGNRNGKVSEVMPMPGMESAVYYVIEYEQKNSLTEEWHKRVDIKCLIQVEEKYRITCEIKLQNEDYDGTTNSLLKELETAYGLDLSAWYAQDKQ